MELSNNPRSRGHEEAPPVLLSDLTQVKNSSFSAAQQQGYSATIFLRRKDKLEKTQQKCIAIFALLCCFAVLLVLIFSSVDLWGDSEDGITEENCRTDCRIVLMETIPEDLKEHLNARPHLPLFVGFHALLDRAKHSVQVVSPVWNLRPLEEESTPTTGRQRLLTLKSRGVKLKIASSLTNSAEQKILATHSESISTLAFSPPFYIHPFPFVCYRPDAEVHLVNMTAFTRGGLHSSFWIVDRTHFYVGSADMDWRSFSKRKELGLMVYNCSCLALDLHRVFSFYWQLHERDYIPSIWSKRVTALYGRHQPLELQLNNTPAVAYVSSSPGLFCAKERTKDVDAIYHVMQSAKTFVFISVTDYLPLVSRRLRGTLVTRYWSPLDEMIREAVVLRGIKVRLLISFWKNTHPLTFNFVTSLQSLCMQLYNCSLEVRFFSHKEQNDDVQHGLNHNKYMLTDNALYIGNHNWVGNEFSDNGGVGLVVQMKNRGGKIMEQLKAAFERDWTSPYSKSLLGNQDRYDKYGHLH
ncbi:inactive phospholipase D5 isoform X2 [Syngnathoides biaculeatus]|uniref:inactive phospholipase D5 isoform X2 n=1 Tax=Syngnathoides biaculeatus TaxID=300417 RepID=UPI002ADD4ED5|nr:inactive phospholipase D5 isoform X2 [Syngnathoides biaculeatus]